MTSTPVSRRGVLAGIAGGALIAGLGELAAPEVADAADAPAVMHVIRRATYGPTPGLVSYVRRVGVYTWLEAQLHPYRQVDDTAMANLLTRWPRLHWTMADARDRAPHTWEIMYDLVDAHIARAAWSHRQLLELMVDFWSNHLNVTCPSSDVWDSRHLYDRDVIRKHALGSFDDMLVASAKHPSMLNYLNNALSTNRAANENYGRELLELHTVGLAAGYSESDVRNSALILTGLTLNPDTGHFVYQPSIHYVGPVQVLGFRSSNGSASGGLAVAESYLRYLAHHPSTARHICQKLAVRFVSDHPSSDLVSHLASVYLANGTAIVPVLRALFHSAEFAASAGKKTRTPFEALVAAIRVLGVRPASSGTSGIRDLHWSAAKRGQRPLGWRMPNGYPDTADKWVSASGTLARWNANLELAAGWWPDTLRHPAPRSYLPKTLPSTYGGYVDALVKRLCLPPLTTDQRRAVAAFLDHLPGDHLKSTDAAVGWRLPYVIALLLDSPNAVRR